MVYFSPGFFGAALSCVPSLFSLLRKTSLLHPVTLLGLIIGSSHLQRFIATGLFPISCNILSTLCECSTTQP